MSVYCYCCKRKASRREAVGPTGRKSDWMIQVDTCSGCGRHYPTDRSSLTPEQVSWVRRWNRKMNDVLEPDIYEGNEYRTAQ